MSRAHAYLMAHGPALHVVVRALTVLAVTVLVAALTKPLVTWGEP